MTAPVVPDRRLPAHVTALAVVLERADEERTKLVAEGDLETLARGLAQLRDIKRQLADFERAVESDIAGLMPQKRVTVDGMGTLERRKGTDRKQWDSEELLRRLIRLAVDPAGDGELCSAAEAIERLQTMVTTCLPITGSLGWRVTGLRGYGIQVDEWCESTPGRQTVQIHGGEGS